jgi:N-acetylneuraminic acid mutarotase
MKTLLRVLAVFTVFSWLAPISALARELSFEERVDAQRAIERVYYSHQIGTTRPFDEAVPESLLEKKVHDYLKKSAALERFWNTPVTGEALHRELERITRETRLPERLREIYAALGQDPFLIEECFVRPALVDRLSKSFLAGDGNIQLAARQKAEDLLTGLERGEINPNAEHSLRSVVTVVEGQADADSRLPFASPARGSSLIVSSEEFLGLRHLQETGKGAAEITEDRESIAVRTVLKEERGALLVAVYRFAKTTWEDFWPENEKTLDETTVRSVSAAQAIPALVSSPQSSCQLQEAWINSSLNAAPDPVEEHTAIWTGTLMIVWGGWGNSPAPFGGWRYDPLIDSWSRISFVNAPSARMGHTAMWTGSEMIVWGGAAPPPHSRARASGSPPTNTGGRYDPVLDSWSTTSLTDAPIARSGHTAIWTGTEMIIWGGKSDLSTMTNSGGRYNPATDTWTPTLVDSTAPVPRTAHTAVWTGSRMIVWGGKVPGPNSLLVTSVATGASYDPVTDTWDPTPLGPSARADHTAVWTGNRMIVWGGTVYSVNLSGQQVLTDLNTGGRYDPSTSTWTATRADATAPIARGEHTAVWTGARMIVWGGTAGAGRRYDPISDTWLPVATSGDPSQNQFRIRHTAVWTGSRMIVWGGDTSADRSRFGVGILVNTGGRYDESSDSWTPTASGPAEARSHHSAVWTGNEMIVWGGVGQLTLLLTGAGYRYDPLLDSWQPTSLTGAPTGRFEHTTVWTGSSMIVWGGQPGLGDYLSSGGRYNPTADSWEPTTLTGAPTGRAAATAVWTGTRMLVWGGYDTNGTAQGSGSSYDPAGDQWQPISSDGAPSARLNHQSVWSGSEMLTWGGMDGSGNRFQTGGRYDPGADHWEAMSLVNAPEARRSFTAVWTGDSMIVWGGYPGLNSGGIYNPPTDSWTSTTLTGAPAARDFHAAVWTGTRMIVWGGEGIQVRNDGSVYDPAGDSWSPLTLENAPSPRLLPSAVWTGDQMIVWGGMLPVSTFTTRVPLNSGGIYTFTAPVDQDSDGDGYPCSTDCDDTNPAVHPGAAETCNGIDDNCDATTDEAGDALCADTDPCTLDLCGGTGGCSHPAAPDGSECSDGDACTVGDTCQGGACLGVTAPDGTSCSDGLDCTSGEACSSGVCSGGLPNQPPTLSVSLNPSILTPMNHKLVDVHATVVAADSCGTPLSGVLVSIASNEPDDATGPSDGHTTGDIQGAAFGTVDFDFQLRAERDSNGTGRIYTVTYSTQDSAGQTHETSGTVTVPLKKNSRTPIILTKPKGKEHEVK